MQAEYVQRDIDDMDTLMEELEKVTASLRGYAKDEYINVMESVVNEWYRDTAPQMRDMLQTLE